MLGEGSVLAIIAAINEEEGIGPTIAELRQFIEKPWILVVHANSRARALLRESSGSSN